MLSAAGGAPAAAPPQPPQAGTEAVEPEAKRQKLGGEQAAILPASPNHLVWPLQCL